MLPKKRKLPIQKFFKKTGVTLKSRCFLLKIFPPEMRYSRFGVVIGAKVVSKATQRNRLRRIIFNFLREKIQELPVRDYLIILLLPAVRARKEELVPELSLVLNLKP